MRRLTTSHGHFSRPRRALGGAAAVISCAVLAGCAAGSGTGAVADGHGAGSVRPSATPARAPPQPGAPPQVVTMPSGLATTPGAPHSPSASHPAATGSPGPTSAQSAPATCASPQYTTSDQYGMWHLDPYFVYNDMWGISGYQVRQTLYACSYSNWYVVATMNNNSGDGHVKTYPNSHRDYASQPKITSFGSITSSFNISGTPGGIYEYAYDIWVNGIASNGSTEVMIWNYNHGQRPAGSVVATATLGGRTYQVWKSGTYIAFVASQNFTSGTLDLLQVFKWIIRQGWLTSSATLGQVDYGVELVSTGNVPARFSFSGFSVNAS
jgi:hypothetical protein